MKTTPSVTRRQFVGGLLQAALASATAPLFVPSRLLGGDAAPSNRIRIGHIGTGNQGTGDMKNFLTVDASLSAAVCDPFRSRRENAARIMKETQGHDPAQFNDFRELLADKTIDAVVIATPDHWHVPIALAAVRAGKDVYVEKPLGHTLAQNRLLMDAVRKHGRVFQYGTQQRSGEMIKRAVELVRNGYLGDLQRVDVWAPGGRGGGSLEEIPVPDGLDYELYIGPAPMKPCTKDRITNQGSWFCSDYALGFIAGWGAHPLDVAIWGMDGDQAGPFTLRGTGTFPTPNALFDTCASWEVDVAFTGGVTMRFVSHDKAAEMTKLRADQETNGTTFHGSKGWVSVSRNGYAASHPDWLKLRQCEGTHRVLYKNRYYQAFIDSVRERSPSIAPIEDAVRSDALSHLSLIAIKSGGDVVWDPKAYRIKSPAALNAQMDHPVRGKWLDA